MSVHELQNKQEIVSIQTHLTRQDSKLDMLFTQSEDRRVLLEQVMESLDAHVKQYNELSPRLVEMLEIYTTTQRVTKFIKIMYPILTALGSFAGGAVALYLWIHNHLTIR